jgi:HK97 family phage major capsid protein
MPTLLDERNSVYAEAQKIVEAAKAAARPMAEDESAKVQQYIERIKDLDGQITRQKADEQMLTQLGSLGIEQGKEMPADDKKNDDKGSEKKEAADTLGEHFVKSKAYATLKSYSGERFTVSAPEYEMKASTFVTGGPALTGLTQTQYGQVVGYPLERPTVASLLSQGQLAATSLTYYVQTSAAASASGGFATVAEAGVKPQLGFSFSPTTETLHKIAGWYAISDEAITDTPYLRSVIDGQLMVRLALAEEQQLLTASGGGNDMTGLLNRSIQSVAASGVTTASGGFGLNNLVALLNAQTLIQTATFLQPNGLVINPFDYQKLRLATDANAQLYGGGPFTGAYGNSGLPNNPEIWGYRTVVTTAIPQGTGLVGNFSVGAQMFRKGGVRVDSTNTDQDDFIHNIVKVRAEERLLLAVYQPLAFCKVSFA